MVHNHVNGETGRATRRRGVARLGAGLAAMTLLALVGMPGAQAADDQRTRAVPLPTSMASTGDSITRGFDVDVWHLLRDNPQFSWSTGDSASIDSHYDRLLALGPAIRGHAYNDARTGARMDALEGQLGSAAGQKVDYATVLMGANDLCTKTAAEMTPVATFHDQFARALRAFTQADPHALVFVSSIPNLRQLWTVLHPNPLARNTWRLFGICQSMLSEHNTDGDRAAVERREQAFNAALAEVCARYQHCRWDNLATYHQRFTTDDVSTGDFFHPSKRGQHVLAEVTWRASFYHG